MRGEIGKTRFLRQMKMDAKKKKQRIDNYMDADQIQREGMAFLLDLMKEGKQPGKESMIIGGGKQTKVYVIG